MRTLRVLLLSLVAVALLGATAFGAGLAARELDTPTAPAGAVAPGPRSTGTTTEPEDVADPEPDAEPEPRTTEAPEPHVLAAEEPLEQAFRIEQGDRGRVVRELQHRLYQLAWWPERTTGSYDAATADAVAGFQGKRGFATTGVVDRRTWRRLRAMTEQPTHDQMFNILRPGPAIYAGGSSGRGVREVQARLVQIAWLFGDVSGRYDGRTVTAVRGFQRKRQIPVTGEVDRRTLDRLVAMTSTPTHAAMFNVRPRADGSLDARCRTGRAMCVDKATNTLRWVVDGQVRLTVDVRFGSDELPTREGLFAVQRKSRDHVSSLYDTSMPFAMFFSGGQAVHYSPDFAANGYNGASHGCVNVRDYGAVAGLFDQVQVGDKVVVYWS
jgi:peptidoglycan hydrolase-like protein with peptidoglycan-binding domain